MGGTSCKGTQNSNKTISIAILGLDNAGKTTTARVLENASIDSIAPTIGYSQTEILHKNEKIKLIDLGGAKTFRDAWRHYYDDAYGFVYVLDSSEENRLGENRDVLKRLLQEDKVKGKPILILANKQDKADALDKNAILEDLKIERLVNENKTLCRVELCSAKSVSRNGKNSKIDESIRHGFDWLIKIIYENYEALNKRVEQDVKKRTESEQKEKRERQERVRQQREERDKQEGTAIKEEDEDDATMKNGFVPIGQAVKNAERNTSEKPSKNKSNHSLSKSKTTNENGSFPPIPAPRSSSQIRRIINNENSDDEEYPRRNSTEISPPPPRREESPIARSVSSRFDDNEPDEQTPVRSTTGKKKKVIGAGRHRLHGDTLPPLAPSASASRRDDLAQNKGPPLGTPRPQAVVAQWAITSPAPQKTAEKLQTIASDNELDDDEKRYKSNKRIVSPHPVTTNRVINDRKIQSKITNNDDDDDYITRKSTSSVQKIRSKLSDDDDDDDEFGDNRKKTNSKEQDRYSKQRYDKNDEEDLNTASSRRARKPPGGDSSSRSHSRTNGNNDDDDDDDDLR